MFIKVRTNGDWMARTAAVGFHERLGLIMKKPVIVIREEIAVQWWERWERRQPLFYLRVSLADFEETYGFDPVELSVVHLGQLKKWPVKKDEAVRNLLQTNPEGYAIYAIGKQTFVQDDQTVVFPIKVVEEILPVFDEKIGTLLPREYRNDSILKAAERKLFNR
ncbi:MAG: hypothetical protein WC238_03415 [Parcubacteria group bacterium]|jgi:hypothetical protein